MRPLLKNLLSARAKNRLYRAYYPFLVLRLLRGRYARTCPVCGFSGLFRAYGVPPRLDAECPRCQSLERHRLLFLCFAACGVPRRDDVVLHFAPEPCLAEFIRRGCHTYLQADLRPTGVDVALDIERIGLRDGSASLVICNHVFEEVTHEKALAEIARILTPGGSLICTVPLVEGWAKTYENPAVVDPADRFLHYGTPRDRRYFGRDFRDDLAVAGFEIDEFTAEGADCASYGLIKGEKVFLCRRKPT